MFPPALRRDVEDRLNHIIRYLTAFGFVAIAIAVRVALHPWLPGTLTHPTVFIAVLIAAWYCGTGPALMDVILGYIGIEYFLFGTFSKTAGGSIVAQLALYGGLNAIILVFVARHRGEQRNRKHNTDRKGSGHWRLSTSAGTGTMHG